MSRGSIGNNFPDLEIPDIETILVSKDWTLELFWSARAGHWNYPGQYEQDIETILVSKSRTLELS